MLQYMSKVDIVYNVLMEEFLNGGYTQGDRIIISRIAQQLNVSETPVREAIRMLESEGYVQVSANQGAVVSGFAKEKIVNLVQIKGVLEAYATRLSIDYLTPEDIQMLRGLNRQFQIAYEQNHVKRYSDLNEQFHMEIYKRNPNQDLRDTIKDLWKKWAIHKAMFSIILESARLSVQEHEQTLVLIEQKDYDRIEEHVRNHKFRSGYEVVRYIEKHSR